MPAKIKMTQSIRYVDAMNITSAVSNGISFGACVGTLACAAAVIGAGTTFALPALVSTSLATPTVATFFMDLVVSTIASAGVFGALFGATHAVVHTVPGLSTVVGEPKKTKFQSRAAQARAIDNGRAPDEFAQEAEYTETNYARTDHIRDNWREEINAERAAQQMMEQNMR